MGIGQWPALAEALVEVDLRIEDLDSWATAPADIDELGRLEELRDELRFALTTRHLSRRLRRLLSEHGPAHDLSPATIDPRD